MSFTLKIGSTSIVLGDYYYGKVITPRKDKLLKVSKVLRNHNEFKHLSIIRTIENYTNYFSIPEDDTYIVNPEDKIYKEIKNLVSNERTNIFLGPLIYSFIDNAGVTSPGFKAVISMASSVAICRLASTSVKHKCFNSGNLLQ